jgi:hypothetical protein
VQQHAEHDPAGRRASNGAGKVGEHAFEGDRQVAGCVPHLQAMLPAWRSANVDLDNRHYSL